mmetsp:Transcript_20975/g.45599  ORF Transcript_20975/g.45599 Transcript_20975/m.45599 type:complete len:292 (-) Transcript_20975:140-1015(-)
MSSISSGIKNPPLSLLKCGVILCGASCSRFWALTRISSRLPRGGNCFSSQYMKDRTLLLLRTSPDGVPSSDTLPRAVFQVTRFAVCWSASCDSKGGIGAASFLLPFFDLLSESASGLLLLLSLCNGPSTQPAAAASWSPLSDTKGGVEVATPTATPVPSIALSVWRLGLLILCNGPFEQSSCSASWSDFCDTTGGVTLVASANRLDCGFSSAFSGSSTSVSELSVSTSSVAMFSRGPFESLSTYRLALCKLGSVVSLSPSLVFAASAVPDVSTNDKSTFFPSTMFAWVPIF